MSGPKSYSVSVFDKQLKHIFLLQSEITTLWETLKSKKLLNPDKNMETDAGDFLAKNKKSYEEFCNPFSLSEKGTINQEQFDTFYNKIQHTINLMVLFKEQISGKIADFSKIEAAYKDYLDLEKYSEKLSIDFQYLKSDFIRYFTENQNDFDDPGKMISEVEKATLTIEMPVFNQVFVETKNDWKRTFDQKFENKKMEINQLTLQTSGTRKTTVPDRKNKAENDPPLAGGIFKQKSEYENLVKKTQEAIVSLGETSEADGFRQRFNDLITNKNRKESYFFSELLEEVTQSKIQSDLRESVQEISGLLQSTNFYNEQFEAVTSLNKKIKAALLRDRLKSFEVEILRNSFHQLLADRQKTEHQKFAAQQERNFIKARLINELQELDYEVMTDMNVVDFEKDNSFLFRTPGQENFINLRFDQQGHLLYNFLIPENRGDLSHEKTQIRLAEMQQTCGEFKEVLANLKKQGLKIDLEKEIEATTKALIQLPEKFAQFKATSKNKATRRTSKERKKHLGQ